MNKCFLVIQVISVMALIQSCDFNSKYESDERVIQVINELQPCEEENIFYKIIDGDVSLSEERDSLVLLTFSKDLDTAKMYNLFFPATHHRRLKIKVKGSFSTKKLYNSSYGCPGSKEFIITEVISTVDVTESMNFKINYK